MKKIISILGSTGSIGLNSIEIIKKKNFIINVLSANSNYKLISKQIVELKPLFYVINDRKVFEKVKKKFRKSKVKILNNFNSLNKNISKSDITIAAITGIAGLSPTIEMIKKSKKILIANKETIICGWNLIKKDAQKYKTEIIPLDSEHFSIKKLLENNKIKNIDKIYLTASGGPFLNYNISKLKDVKPHQAIKHPKWQMGKKISIDSSTLMNKMLELIEASKLFSLNSKKIEIVIHPESLVHAIIKLNNGLYKFIYHETTMLIPLANCIFNDDLKVNEFLKTKDLFREKNFPKNLSFMNVDKKRFPLIQLKSRITEHHSTPIIINAANEILVDQYLNKKIPYTSFFRHILNVLNDRNYKKYAIRVPTSISQILQIDKWSRETIYKKIENKKNA